MDRIVKNALYNLIGSFVYLFSQWSMSVLIVRLSGSYEEAGVFGTAMAVSNIFYMISTFSVRNYQVADIKNKFSNGEYFSCRIVTCVASLVILPLYLIAMRYSAHTALCIICYMLIKSAEAIVDATQGIFQKAWRLDIVCRSLVIRGIINLAVFSLSEIFLKNLAVSLLLTAIASWVAALLLDIGPCNRMFEISFILKNKRIIKLLSNCFPLFIHGFLTTLIYNLPRIIAQKICGEQLFGFYASITTPTVIIQVAALNIFSPCITVMSEQYHKKEKKLFTTIIGIQGTIALLTLAGLAGFALLGEYFLKYVFNPEILAYKDLLLPSVIVAAVIATTAFVASIFTVSGHNTVMVVLESAAFVVNIIMSVIMIKNFGLQGINYTLMISCSFFIILGYYMIIRVILKEYNTAAPG